MDTASTTQELLEREHLRELRYRYCEYLDAKAYDDWVSLFTDDVRFDARRVPGMDMLEGKDELKTFIDEYLSTASEFAAHHVFHPRLSIDDDTASGTWVLDEIAVSPDGTVCWMQGEYQDEYVRVHDGWKIAETSVVIHAQAEIECMDMRYPHER